jgi:hypothetical protein
VLTGRFSNLLLRHLGECQRQPRLPDGSHLQSVEWLPARQPRMRSLLPPVLQMLMEADVDWTG